jgi:hypothetical protein
MSPPAPAAIRILAMVANPHDGQTFDARGEREALESGLRVLVNAGKAELAILEEASENALRHRLAVSEWHIVHFIGRGRSGGARYSTLVFEGHAGHSRSVTVRHFGEMLRAHDSIRLAVLQGCCGESDSFREGAALLAENVPAVVTVTPSSRNAAEWFAHIFYSALAAGESPAQAAARVRETVAEIEITFHDEHTGGAIFATGSIKITPGAEHAAVPKQERHDRAAAAPVLESHDSTNGIPAASRHPDGAAGPAPEPRDHAAPAPSMEPGVNRASAPITGRLVHGVPPAPAPATQVPRAPDPLTRGDDLERRRAAGKFDVFLCHNIADKPAIKIIGRQLMERGILPWLDEWELRPGMPWQRLLEEQVAGINAAAVFVGPNGMGPWQRHELDSFLRQFAERACPVIPVLLSNAPGEPKLPMFLQNMTWVDFRGDANNALDRLIWGITGCRGSLR